MYCAVTIKTEIEIEPSCTVLQYHFEPQGGAVGQRSVKSAQHGTFKYHSSGF